MLQSEDNVRHKGVVTCTNDDLNDPCEICNSKIIDYSLHQLSVVAIVAVVVVSSNRRRSRGRGTSYRWKLLSCSTRNRSSRTVGVCREQWRVVVVAVVVVVRSRDQY